MKIEKMKKKLNFHVGSWKTKKMFGKKPRSSKPGKNFRHSKKLLKIE
jgi:hypothetical protein